MRKNELNVKNLSRKEADAMARAVCTLSQVIVLLKELCKRAADTIEACSIRYDPDIVAELRKAALVK